MKKVAGIIIAVIILCYPAAAHETTAFDGEAKRTLTIAQASEYVYCPECGAKNEAGAAYCSGCGKELPKEAAVNYCPECGAKIEAGAVYCPSCGEGLARRTVTKWDRNIVAISFNAGGLFGDNNFGGVGTDVAFQVSDYFAFGPEFSYMFGSDSTYLLPGLEFRPYFVPYSRSISIKPHAYVGGGYARLTGEVGIISVSFDGGYARAGGGVDFRIPDSMVVPYFDAGFFITFFEGENFKKGQVEGGVRLAI